MARYIDAEEFIEDIKAENTNLMMNGLKGTPRQMALSAEDVIERINEIPSADVREVKHGKWIPTTNGKFECSVCHSVWNRTFLHDPHCGAKMDGDTKEAN